MSVPVIIAIVVGIVVSLGAVVVLLKRLKTQSEQAVRERFPNAKLILSSVNFFGQLSRGKMQMRGNGTLALTENELYFELWIPHREFHVPLNSIQSIETPKAFLGKSVFRPLLKITFQNETGETDAMAWYVPDVESLISTIEALRR